MSKKDLIEELEELLKNNDKESNNKAIELVNKSLFTTLDSKKAKQLESIKNRCKINLLTMELNEIPESDKKNKINKMGKLIKLYNKQESLETDEKKQMSTRHEKVELLKQQKELTKDYRKNDKDIKLSEKVGLTIKEISNTIRIFLNEKDVLFKIERILKETIAGGASSAALIAAIGIATQAIVGIPFTLSSLASCLPVLAYIGLTSIIRNISTKTKFEKYEYYQSEEYKKYVEQFKEENKELLAELDSLLKEKDSVEGFASKYQMNEALIKKIDEICSQIKDQALRNAYELQALGFCRENKKLCQEEIDNYLDEKNDDLVNYSTCHKLLTKTNLQIFKRENSFKDAFVHAGKGMAANTAVMVLAKAIITLVAPNSSYAIQNLTSLALPAALAIINGLIDIPTYKGKLKYQETSENTKVDPEDKEKIDTLFNSKQLQMA